MSKLRYNVIPGKTVKNFIKNCSPSDEAILKTDC